MIYGSRSRADMIFAVEIEELAAAHPERFSLHLALDHAHEGYDGLVGPLDDAQVTRALDALPACELPRTYFVCGPTPMREAARRALAARGVEPAHIREEVYASPHRPRAQSGSAERVTLRIIDMPYSCAMGGCGACRCQRVAGEVVMETPNCLTEAERAEGAVLTCVGRPAGPGVVLEVP
jgi:ferredoxin-NADP reductase